MISQSGSRRFSRFVFVSVVAATWMCWTPSKTWAEPSIAELARINNAKAESIYNFARSVPFRDDRFDKPDSPIVIGVFGNSPITGRLKILGSHRKVNNRKIVIRSFSHVDHYEPCHVLFVADSVTPEDMTEILHALERQPVLLIGDTPGFAEHGGSVNFRVQDGKVRFEVNGDNLRSAD